MFPILMILAPFPIGWFVRNRVTAFVAFLALFSFLFTYQSVYLITKWTGGSKNAFGGFPKSSSSDVWGYGVVNLVFLVVGIGLLTLGGSLQGRRRSRVLEPLAV